MEFNWRGHMIIVYLFTMLIEEDKIIYAIYDSIRFYTLL